MRTDRAVRPRCWWPAFCGLLALAVPAPAQSPNAPAARPQVWAVLIGIQRYEEGLAFPRCRGAAADAAALGRWLIDTAGWSRDQVLLLSDQDPESLGFTDPARRPAYRPATKANLDWGMREWLAGKVKPGDVIVVFFAGQAVGLPPRPDEPPGRPPRDYLLPVDARTTALDTTGWVLGDAIEGLAARGGNPIICLLDTSPAGRIQSPAVLGTPPRSASGERMLKGISRWPGVTAWMAASGKPSGQAQNGDGILTRSLLEALGTRSEPQNLLACLDRLRRDNTLSRQGFLTEGGFDPNLTLWPTDVVRKPRSDPPLLQRGHGDRVTAIAFSADGSRMITTSMDSTLRLWHAPSGTLTRVLPFVKDGYWSLALSGDGRLLVAGGGDGRVQFHDLEHEVEKSVPRVNSHLRPVDRVAVLPVPAQAGPPAQRALHHVLTADNTGRVVVWDASRTTVRRLNEVADSGGRLTTAASRPGPAAAALVMPDRAGNDVIRTIDFRGERVRDLVPPKGRVTALELAADGSRAWAGTEDGVVEEFDTREGKSVSVRRLNGEVSAIAARAAGLIIAAGPSIHVLPEGQEAKELVVKLDRPAARLAVSVDGRRFAACDAMGGPVRAWELDAEGSALRALTLDRKAAGEALSLAFSPGGETLVSGDGSGALRSWELPDGQPRPTIPASRGRVRHLAVSGDEKRLLQVTDDGIALLWELANGRTTLRIPGFFTPAGGFLKNGDIALIDQRGDVVLHDRISLMRKPVVFERPLAENSTRRSGWAFHALVVGAEDRLAAASRDGPLACVWTPDGRLALDKPIRDHRGGIGALGFSRDARALITASDDGVAKLWDVSGKTPKLVRVLGREEPGQPVPPAPVTAAAVSPDAAGPIVLGRQDGRIELWAPGAAEPARLARLEGQVRSLAFSIDGKLVAGAGDDRQIVLRAVKQPAQPIPLQTSPNHFEMINAVAFWPGGRLLASASDDGTVRLWRLDQAKLSGTLWVSGDGAEWVVYTPDGLYDASAAGERRVTWNPPGTGDGGIRLPARLEQYRKQRFVFDLADTLARGEDVKEPAAVPPSDPPAIKIEPVSTPGPKQRRVDLKLRVADGASGLRLYQNGVAVESELKGQGGSMETSVTLVSGSNRIYALAERPAGIDGRSNQLELFYDGPTPGRTHILALGVSRYRVQALQFADRDAQAISGFLKQKKLAANPPPANQPIVLVNERVSRDSVTRSFQDLRRRVRGRPEDTVIVFLAGHTDIRQGYFCLLLPSAELPAGPPIVAMRAPQGEESQTEPTRSVRDDVTVLPYGMIHSDLLSLDSLNRLVIVDACQASALFDDPRVRAGVRRSVRRLAEDDAHRARTSYILATRRGERERAVEADVLEHGLLTYALLRGMGEPGLRRLQPELPVFVRYPNADLDQDGWVDTGELRQYSDLTVPALLDQFPKLAARGAAEPSSSSPGALVSQDADASFSFPLLEAPTASAATTSR